jgi:hypothetical protein
MAALLIPQDLPDYSESSGRRILSVVPDVCGAPLGVVVSTAVTRERPEVLVSAVSQQVFWARRAVVAIVLLTVLAVVASLAALGVQAGWAMLTGGGAAMPVDSPVTYVVQPGDTLWSVARSLQPMGDVRPLVGVLSEHNGGAALVVGQVLELQ